MGNTFMPTFVQKEGITKNVRVQNLGKLYKQQQTLLTGNLLHHLFCSQKILIHLTLCFDI